MNIQVILTSKDIGFLKQRARKLKQEQGITHTEALDLVAQQAKFNHWHHVCETHKFIEPTETAFLSGVIVAFDVKEAEDFFDEENLFVEDDYAFWVCQDDLYREYSEATDDDDVPIKNLKNEEELREDFEIWMMNFRFFRFTGRKIPETMEELINLIKERCFWQPWYVWLKGQFHNTFFKIDNFKS
jgi:hypothetical protein